MRRTCLQSASHHRLQVGIPAQLVSLTAGAPGRAASRSALGPQTLVAQWKALLALLRASASACHRSRHRKDHHLRRLADLLCTSVSAAWTAGMSSAFHALWQISVLNFVIRLSARIVGAAVGGLSKHSAGSFYRYMVKNIVVDLSPCGFRSVVCVR